MKTIVNYGLARPLRSLTLPARQAFTLVELLVVAVIVGVLLGLIISGVQRAREAANCTQCANQMRQLSVATLNFHNDRKHLPRYVSGHNGQHSGGWMVPLLPYVEQEAAYEEIRAAHQMHTRRGKGMLVTGAAAHPSFSFPNLICPSDPTASLGHIKSTTSYVANWFAFANGERGFYLPPYRLDEFTDGLANTVLFAEAYSQCNELPRWALHPVYFHNFGVTQTGLPADDPIFAPGDFTMFQVQPSHDECDKQRTQTPHAAMHIALADGSIQFVTVEVAVIWKQLLKPRDGLPVSVEWN